MLNKVAAFLELGHDAVVGCDAVAIVAGLKGFDEDDITNAVVSEHDVLVAATEKEREAGHVISEEFADGFYPNVKFIGLGEM